MAFRPPVTAHEHRADPGSGVGADVDFSAGAAARADAAAGTAELPEPRVICALGMHRSGTSLVSRLLNILGVYLGSPPAVGAAGSDNPKGYWEHRPLVGVNDEILSRFGGRWDSAPMLPPDWSNDPRLDDLKETARALLIDEFAGRSLWGWKDPRTCLTLPFWQELVGPMHDVICVRNPSAVAASLGRRDGITSEIAGGLWVDYVHASLAHTRGERRMFVFYDDVVSDAASELRRLAAFIGDERRADEPYIREAAAEFLDEELRHHRMSLEDLARDHRVSFPAAALYIVLRGHAAACASPDARSVRELPNLFGARALDAADQMRQAQATATRCDGLSREVECLTASLDWVRAERDRLADEAASVTLRLNRVALERDRTAEQAEATRRVLTAIQNSKAWRVVTRARVVLVRFLPAGTMRRRVFDAMVRRAAGQTAVPPA